MATAPQPLDTSGSVDNPQIQNQSNGQKPGSCSGRKVALCNCISAKTLFTIAAVVGAILFIVGLLGIAGYFAPTSGAGGMINLLQKLGAGASYIASQLGSDLLTLSIFVTAFGGAFTLTGIVGATLQKKSAKPQIA